MLLFEQYNILVQKFIRKKKRENANCKEYIAIDNH